MNAVVKQAYSTETGLASLPDADSIVMGNLSFMRPQNHKAEVLSAALTGDLPEILFDTDAYAVPVSSMRYRAGHFSVDVEGFALLDHTSQVKNFYSDLEVENRYYAEVRNLLADHFDARHVEIFDATRRSDAKGGAANPDGSRGPAGRVHVDYTQKSGPRRATEILGEDEFARLKKVKARIIQVNVWRPITGPVKRAPLALADASTVSFDDLVPTDQIFPDRIGEIYHLKHNPAQQWYYAPEMETDEVLLIKGWDSVDDGRARFTPHSAFDLPNADKAPPRESIEIRTLVVIE
jgi:hypothetical protein